MLLVHIPGKTLRYPYQTKVPGAKGIDWIIVYKYYFYLQERSYVDEYIGDICRYVECIVTVQMKSFELQLPVHY